MIQNTTFPQIAEFKCREIYAPQQSREIYAPQQSREINMSRKFRIIRYIATILIAVV